jgi:hypothetical protein
MHVIRRYSIVGGTPRGDSKHRNPAKQSSLIAIDDCKQQRATEYMIPWEKWNIAYSCLFNNCLATKYDAAGDTYDNIGNAVTLDLL